MRRSIVMLPLIALCLPWFAHAEEVRFAPAGDAAALPAAIPAAQDRYSHRGKGGSVTLAPDARIAAAARDATIAFFRNALAAR